MKTLALAGVLFCALMLHADTVRPSLFKSTVYYPLSAMASGSTVVLTNAVDVYTVVASNTNASTAVTLTVSCTGGQSFVNALMNGINSQGNNLAISFPDGVTCTGGVTVTTTGAGVTLQITGKE